MRKGYKVNKNNTETHKQCPQCKEVLARSNFHISRSEHDGFSTYCKKCSVVKVTKSKKISYSLNVWN